ncbi:uncharacterized protein N7477_002197 [Penicillium maclennaniae]|uniref:uncharacterized protein n=1 Tax=Penicillium maclennaniae TaxID=1343394 RepID=UPI002541AEC9|nr:uncharacterized protein N7477_002197 [Penicillium maclennaniae]KAJ5676564.1 hypothetical protein N7477_002197 [Penicillium maclennaniae]
MSPIILNHTLADLYSEDGDVSNLVAVFAYPTARSQGIASSPSSKKFIYQTPLAPSTNQDAVERRRLHNIPLKMAFTMGKMPIVLFDLDRSEMDDNGEYSHHVDACKVLDQLHPNQRPNITFTRGPDEIQLQKDARIVILSPLDFIAHLPHAVDPEIHYDLLSKRGLAYSGLPTPRTVVMDSISLPSEGFSSTQIKDEIQRMMCPIYEREVPFIVKVPQAVGGLGTFIVRTEAQRQAAATVLETELGQILRNVTSLNQHLQPCCLIIQDFVPGDTLGLTLFVTQLGRPIFIGCCTQAVDIAGLWSGGTISYPRQAELQKRFGELMDKIARLLHKKGYYGPAGVDIMIDQNGKPLIIDFNVRVTGSYSLGCLRSHFEQRGLCEALLSSINPHCSREDFQNHFKEEFEHGIFIMITWTSHMPDGSSLAMVCMGAPDQTQLQDLAARLATFVSASKDSGPDGHNLHTITSAP